MKIKDKKTGIIYDSKTNSLDKLAMVLNDEVNSHLVYCDLEGLFKNVDSEEYYLIDECNNHIWIDPERFEIYDETFINTEKKIIDLFCNYYKINIKDLKIKTRKREVVILRQQLMWMLRKYTKLSVSKIGAIFFQNHATATNCVKVVNDLRETDKEYSQKFTELNDFIISKL